MKRTTIFLLILAFSIFCSLNAQNILIWDNDNNSTVVDPSSGNLIGCEDAIENALDEINQTYTTVTALPADLTEYDVLFATLGKYCLG